MNDPHDPATGLLVAGILAILFMGWLVLTVALS